jgi:FkbM family methyltransferase
MNSITLERGDVRREFTYRPGTSDEAVIEQMFHGQHYNLAKLARHAEIDAFLQRMRQQGRQPLIIDAGANIGAASVCFALMYPEARVVAIEPETENYSLLCANVQGLNVRCIQAALAGKVGSTHLIDPGIGTFGYRTAASGDGAEVPTVTMPNILQEHGEPPYFSFLVKLDIEGGEKEVFEGDTDWVQNTPVVIVELHDWLLSRQQTALPFLRCISKLDRDFVYIGENIFSICNRLEN